MITETKGSALKKNLLIAAGTICVVLAIFGMVLPVLPTTPFLLLAAICYERSSPRFYEWLITNKYFGEYIKNYREGRGIPMRQKIITLAILWVSIGYGAFFVSGSWWLSLLLLSVAIGVTIHLARVKTFVPAAVDTAAIASGD